MRTITKEIKAYKFNELSDTAKNNIIFGEFNYYSDMLEDDIKIYLDEVLGLDYSNLEYSISHSQGDGLTFTLDSLKFEDIKDSPCFSSYKKSHLKYFCDNFHNIVDFEKKNHHYSHENTYSVTFYDFNFTEYVVNNHRATLFVDKLHDITSDFKDYYRNMLQDIYRKAIDFQEYYTSEEYIDDTCNCNDYEFTESGKLI